MSCSLSIQIPKALPSLSRPIQSRLPSLPIASYQKQPQSSKPNKTLAGISTKPINCFSVQVGAVLATAAQPAFAVTGVNHEEDLIWVLIQLGIAAFWYFLIMPPIIMNWLRIRWYKRNLLEMYLQFMFVFLFFPGLLLWAPFLNFRKFPRDPTMEYPWSTPQDPSKIKNIYLKYPWAKPEDYEI